MSEALVEVAAVITLLAGIVVGLSALAKFPAIGGVIRWLWRRLVSEPVGAWFKGIVHDSVSAEFAKLSQPNGGKSLADLAEALKRIEQRQTDITGEQPVTE